MENFMLIYTDDLISLCTILTNFSELLKKKAKIFCIHNKDYT